MEMIEVHLCNIEAPEEFNGAVRSFLWSPTLG
jgi:3-dehydroquinate dehydratase